MTISYTVSTTSTAYASLVTSLATSGRAIYLDDRYYSCPITCISLLSNPDLTWPLSPGTSLTGALAIFYSSIKVSNNPAVTVVSELQPTASPTLTPGSQVTTGYALNTVCAADGSTIVAASVYTLGICIKNSDGSSTYKYADSKGYIYFAKYTDSACRYFTNTQLS